MIELKYLASEFNKLLGTNDFKVYENTNLVPEDESEQTITTMVATRLPFALPDVNSETLNLTFTFDLIASDETVCDRRLSLIKEILGWKSFQVATPDGETYNVDSFLEQLPMGLPRIDTGVTIQQVVVTGTCLVAVSSLGAVVSNRIATDINGTAVKVISATPSLSTATDDTFNLSGESTLSESTAISKTPTSEFTLLYLGSDIDNYFIDRIEGEETEINEILTVRRIYPHKTIEYSAKFLGGTIVEQAGAYLIYKVNLQRVVI